MPHAWCLFPVLLPRVCAWRAERTCQAADSGSRFLIRADRPGLHRRASPIHVYRRQHTAASGLPLRCRLGARSPAFVLCPSCPSPFVLLRCFPVLAVAVKTCVSDVPVQSRWPRAPAPREPGPASATSPAPRSWRIAAEQRGGWVGGAGTLPAEQGASSAGTRGRSQAGASKACMWTHLYVCAHTHVCGCWFGGHKVTAWRGHGAPLTVVIGPHRDPPVAFLQSQREDCTLGGRAWRAVRATVSPRDLSMGPEPRAPHERDGRTDVQREEVGSRREERAEPRARSPVPARTHLPRLQSGDPGLRRPASPVLSSVSCGHHLAPKANDASVPLSERRWRAWAGRRAAARAGAVGRAWPPMPGAARLRVCSPAGVCSPGPAGGSRRLILSPQTPERV